MNKSSHIIDSSNMNKSSHKLLKLPINENDKLKLKNEWTLQLSNELNHKNNKKNKIWKWTKYFKL